MNEKKNIDRLFQEKFKDFEIAPNDAVWDRISESLPNKKKKRRVVPIWWQLGGVAAAIVLLVTVGVSVFNSDPNISNDTEIVDTEKPNNDSENNKTSKEKENELKEDAKFEKLEFADSDNDKESIIDSKDDTSTSKKENKSKNLISNPKSQLNSVAVYSDNKKNGSTSSSQERKQLTSTTDKNNTKVASVDTKNSENKDNNTKLANDTELKSVIKSTIDNNDTAVTENSTPKDAENKSIDSATSGSDKKSETALEEDPKKVSILDALADNAKDEDINEKEKDDERNRWSIAPNVAPVYYSSLGKGSSIDQQFNNNSKSSDINMSYGISGAYAVSDKLKIRTGVNVVNLSQSTSDVLAVTNPNSSPPSASFTLSNAPVVQKYTNVTLNNHTQNLSLMSTESMVSAQDLSSYKASSIDQRFGFIEVPLELEYRLLDKKFGVNVIGGFSTFFLNKNELYADLDGVSTLIGEANNINNTSFSANLGLGLDYSLSKQWNINLEPQFKYQINTFNNTSGNFRPFFIGVYTGLSFKF